MSKAITDKNVPATTLFLFIAPCYSVWFRGKHKLCSFPQFLSSVTRCWLRRILGRTTECLCLKLALYCACFSCRMSQSKEKTDLTLYTPSSNCKELKRNVGSLAEVRKPFIFTFAWTCIQNLWILHFQDWMPTNLWITCELSGTPQVSRQKRKETEIKSQTDLQPFSTVNVTGWPFVCPLTGLQERVLPRTLLWTETMAEAEHKKCHFLPLPSFTSQFILMLETNCTNSYP